MKALISRVSVFVLVARLAGTAVAVNIETVPVGNPGNPADTRYKTPGYGRVDYTYNIGKYEVTTAQYCEFLNKVAKTDTYGLYNMYMDTAVNSLGCNIKRSGSSGNYTYTVGDGSPTDVANWGSRPVNFVSYWDACRFANWLHNGQPTGAQGPGTTETGAYTLNGYNGQDGREIQRNTGWKWAVTSEDEWYKAAYHKNDGVTGNYFDYPTSTNAVPNNGNPGGDTGNSANFYDGEYTIGSPYWRANVGFFGQSDSPYGTFDQGGNVAEMNESVVYEGTGYSHRGLRGGSFSYPSGLLHASARIFGDPSYGDVIVGFRVSEVPEPTAMAMLTLLGTGILRWKRPRAQVRNRKR